MTEIQCSCGKRYSYYQFLGFIRAGIHMKLFGHYIRFYKMPDQEEWQGPLSRDTREISGDAGE